MNREPASLIIWVVYDRPTDFPDAFVARKWDMDRPTAEVLTADTLAEIRKKVRAALPGGVMMLRSTLDDPKIVETWL